jgi:hypothetical protein
MTLAAEDKEWVEGLVKQFTPAAKQGDGHDGEGKEFLLHLYDQLWENMRAKENRLWSFLSLYGAAVGLVFAGGQASGLAGAELFALIIVMGLTVWAILIMLNANFWIRRNLLMVGGIEERYPDIKKGIYPRSFPEVKKGSFDALYRGSVLVLGIMLLLFFARAVWPYRNPTSFDAFHIFLSVILLYVLLISFALYCLKQHEDYISLHNSTRRKQLIRAEKFTLPDWQKTLDYEFEDRKKLSVRPYLLLLLLCVMGLFDFVLRRNGYPWPFFLWCVAPQILLICIFAWQWQKYRSPYNVDAALAPLVESPTGNTDNEAWATKVDEIADNSLEVKWWPPENVKILIIIVLLSVVNPIWFFYVTNLKLREDFTSGTKTVSSADLNRQIEKVQQDLKKIESSFQEMQSVETQRELIEQRLTPFQQRLNKLESRQQERLKPLSSPIPRATP